MPRSRQPKRVLLATAKVLQPGWLGGASLQDAVFDARVPFEDCLGLIDVLCAGVSKNVLGLLEQTRALAEGDQPVFVEVELALHEMGRRDRVWPEVARTSIRVEQVAEAPRYWQCHRAKPGGKGPTITAEPAPLAVSVGELAGMAFTGWAAGLWGLTVQEADRVRANPNRRLPECLLHSAKN